jgi:hypothetical protein
MRALSIVFLTLSLILVISYTHGTAAQKQNEIDAWLDKISGGKPPEIDITGRWHDTQGSGMLTWGEGYLRQEQAKVSGAIGSYNIKGVVSGKIVYLVFLYKGAVYYTARLELFQGLLTGNYFKAKDREQKWGYPTSFARTVEPGKQ